MWLNVFDINIAEIDIFAKTVGIFNFAGSSRIVNGGVGGRDVFDSYFKENLVFIIIRSFGECNCKTFSCAVGNSKAGINNRIVLFNHDVLGGENFEVGGIDTLDDPRSRRTNFTDGAEIVFGNTVADIEIIIAKIVFIFCFVEGAACLCGDFGHSGLAGASADQYGMDDDVLSFGGLNYRAVTIIDFDAGQSIGGDILAPVRSEHDITGNVLTGGKVACARTVVGAAGACAIGGACGGVENIGELCKCCGQTTACGGAVIVDSAIGLANIYDSIARYTE